MPPKIAELLSPYPVISHVPVQWADMDQNQHVNNVIYLKYMEVSRLDFFQTTVLNMARICDKLAATSTRGDRQFYRMRVIDFWCYQFFFHKSNIR